jgi:hypothetical protein
MKKSLLSFLVAIGLIGSASAAPIVSFDVYFSPHNNGNETRLSWTFTGIGTFASDQIDYSESGSGWNGVGIFINGEYYGGESYFNPNAFNKNGEAGSYGPNADVISAGSFTQGSTTLQITNVSAWDYWQAPLIFTEDTSFLGPFMQIFSAVGLSTGDFPLYKAGEQFSYQAGVDNYVLNVPFDVFKVGIYSDTDTTTFVQPWTSTIYVVPEPTTYALFGIGGIGLLMVLRRKKTA